jgi:hypothetical protein
MSLGDQAGGNVSVGAYHYPSHSLRGLFANCGTNIHFQILN